MTGSSLRGRGEQPCRCRGIDPGLEIFTKLAERSFQIPSSEQGHEISFTLALVSETELVKAPKVAPKVFKLNEVVLELEQLGCTLKVR